MTEPTCTAYLDPSKAETDEVTVATNQGTLKQGLASVPQSEQHRLVSKCLTAILIYRSIQAGSIF